MSSASDPHSILNRNPGSGGFQIPAPKAKITRYFPGKAPDWQKDNDSDDDIFPLEPDLKSLGGTSITSDKLNKRLASIEDKPERKTEERVVIRSEKVLEKKKIIKEKEETTKEIKEIHRKESKEAKETKEIKKETVAKELKELKINDSGVQIINSKENEDRRAALKARLLAREENQKTSSELNQKNEEKVQKENEIKEEMEEEIEEKDDDFIEEYEEEGGLINILKPIYVRKNERNGINDKQVVCFLKNAFYFIEIYNGFLA